MAHYLPYFEGLSYLCVILIGCSAVVCLYTLSIRSFLYASASGLLTAIYILLFVTLKVLEAVLR